LSAASGCLSMAAVSDGFSMAACCLLIVQHLVRLLYLHCPGAATLSRRLRRLQTRPPVVSEWCNTLSGERVAHKFPAGRGKAYYGRIIERNKRYLRNLVRWPRFSI
jgi:hypothetical protein